MSDSNVLVQLTTPPEPSTSANSTPEKPNNPSHRLSPLMGRTSPLSATHAMLFASSSSSSLVSVSTSHPQTGSPPATPAPSAPQAAPSVCSTTPPSQPPQVTTPNSTSAQARTPTMALSPSYSSARGNQVSRSSPRQGNGVLCP
jgi:hypothetical protein